MTYEELIATISGSRVEDWTKVEDIVDDNCIYTASYKKDLDIVITWGKGKSNFTEEWSMRFPDKEHNESFELEVKYKGNKVKVFTFVYVDGYRYLMPLPKTDIEKSVTGNVVKKGPPPPIKFYVQSSDMPFFNIMFDLYGAGGSCDDLESALEQANIEIR